MAPNIEPKTWRIFDKIQSQYSYDLNIQKATSKKFRLYTEQVLLAALANNDQCNTSSSDSDFQANSKATKLNQSQVKLGSINQANSSLNMSTIISQK